MIPACEKHNIKLLPVEDCEEAFSLKSGVDGRNP
jgi:hypothetical protein